MHAKFSSTSIQVDLSIRQRKNKTKQSKANQNKTKRNENKVPKRNRTGYMLLSSLWKIWQQTVLGLEYYIIQELGGHSSKVHKHFFGYSVKLEKKKEGGKAWKDSSQRQIEGIACLSLSELFSFPPAQLVIQPDSLHMWSFVFRKLIVFSGSKSQLVALGRWQKTWPASTANSH